MSGISPAYYYYYYCNGLSHSYHDLSQLQQQNMMSIMRRSGFLPDDSNMMDTDIDVMEVSKPNEDQKDQTNRKRTSPRHSDAGEVPKRMSRNTSIQSPSPHESLSPHQNYDSDQFPLERSLSMPTIGPRLGSGGGGTRLVDSIDHSNSIPNEEMISDEVIQELGMWEQVIQEEKKEAKNVDLEEIHTPTRSESPFVEDVDDERFALRVLTCL